jgi:hypothetical protein
MLRYGIDGPSIEDQLISYFARLILTTQDANQLTHGHEVPSKVTFLNLMDKALRC